MQAFFRQYKARTTGALVLLCVGALLVSLVHRNHRSIHPADVGPQSESFLDQYRGIISLLSELEEPRQDLHTGWLLNVQLGEHFRLPVESAIQEIFPCRIELRQNLSTPHFASRAPVYMEITGYPIPPLTWDFVTCGIARIRIVYSLPADEARDVFGEFTRWFVARYHMLPESRKSRQLLSYEQPREQLLLAQFLIPETPLCAMRIPPGGKPDEQSSVHLTDGRRYCSTGLWAHLSCSNESDELKDSPSDRRCSVSIQLHYKGADGLVVRAFDKTGEWMWLQHEWNQFRNKQQ
jgi:hypothetical protein